jgi:hypothetical protein
MDESSPFLISEDGGTLRVAWDNRRVSKDRAAFGCFLIFWIIWAPLTLLATCLIFVPQIGLGAQIFFVIWCIFGWAGTIAIPYGWIATTWSEWIEISKGSFSNGNIGFLVRKSYREINFPLDSIVEVACGYLPGLGSDGGESFITLNVIRSGGILGSKPRHMFGYWLAPDLKVQLFEIIEEFVKKNQIPLKMTRYGPLFGKAGPEPKIKPPSKAAAIDKASPIEITETEETLRLKWDTRRVCSDWAGFWLLALFLTTGTASTLLFGYSLLQGKFGFELLILGPVWLLFFGGTLLIGYQLVQKFWTEWIEVSREYVSQGRIGWFAGKPKNFALASIYELGYSSKDPTLSLTISYGRPDRRRQRSFGYWVNPEFKEMIFQAIEDFVARKQIPLRMIRYGP